MDNSKRPVKKVVKGKVIRRKRPQSSPMGDSLSVALDHVIADILIPLAKDAAFEAVTGVMNQMLFNGKKAVGRSRSSNSSSSSYVSYNRYSSKPEPREGREVSRRARANHSFDTIILETHREAQNLLDDLYICLDQFGILTVSEFYEKVGVKPEYTDDDWGWTSLQGSKVRRVSHGYIVDLPSPNPID